MINNNSVIYLMAFVSSILFLSGGLLRLLIKPISYKISYIVPWFYVGIGFQIGKGEILPIEKRIFYWQYFLTTMILTFIIRTIICNIEFKKTGKVGFFSDSGDSLMLGGFIGMIVRFILN